MKKKLFALASVVVLIAAMNVNVLAANSPASSSAKKEVVVSGDVTATSEAGQSITESTLNSFASSTTITSDTATIGTSLTGTQVNALVNSANEKVDNALIATLVDIVVPAGTTSAKITLSNISAVKADSKVTVLHYKSDGSIEEITPSAVGEGSVTFTMTSFSPVAIVVTGNSTAPAATSTSTAPAATSTSTASAATTTTATTATTTATAPKTADMTMVYVSLAVMSLLCGAFFLRKYSFNK